MTIFDFAAGDPFDMFRQWLTLAEQTEPNDPNAAALATATLSSVPSVRMVLIKKVDRRGLCFFTHSKSQKGRELEQNSSAALCFHWKSLRRQVRFQGLVEPLSHDETLDYFRSRSRASQIAAAVSAQSQPLASRQVLESQFQVYATQLGEQAVPLPEDWSGYRLVPNLIEFWQDGRDRLHDRLQFTASDGRWSKTLLYP